MLLENLGVVLDRLSAFHDRVFRQANIGERTSGAGHVHQYVTATRARAKVAYRHRSPGWVFKTIQTRFLGCSLMSAGVGLGWGGAGKEVGYVVPNCHLSCRSCSSNGLYINRCPCSWWSSCRGSRRSASRSRRSSPRASRSGCRRRRRCSRSSCGTSLSALLWVLSLPTVLLRPLTKGRKP
jgi:hypothetical protein